MNASRMGCVGTRASTDTRRFTRLTVALSGTSFGADSNPAPTRCGSSATTARACANPAVVPAATATDVP